MTDEHDRPTGPASASPAPPSVRRLRELHRREAQRAVAGTLARAIGGAVLLITAYYVLPIEDGSRAVIVLRVVGAGVAIAVIVAWEVRAVSRSSLPQLRAVDALVITVIVVVVAFATAYLNLSSHDPAMFNERLGRTSSLYFTVTTLATVGYGDIHARTDTARIVVMVQMVCNVAVIGATVRLIFSMARRRLTDPPGDAL